MENWQDPFASRVPWITMVTGLTRASSGANWTTFGPVSVGVEAPASATTLAVFTAMVMLTRSSAAQPIIDLR
jgi:hypothetical protein